MVALWQSILSAFAQVLTFLHDVLVPVFGANSWGWAIIVLTLIVRILLLPLAIKQTRSMRAMQAIQPQMKALQKKYKVDRELLKKDPEQYKAKKAKLNEEMMALYQEEGANPAASCLPLLAQAPIFLVLFWTLRDFDDLAGAPFYFVTQFVSAESEFTGLAALVNQAGWPGWLLIVLMSGTMFLSQKQMMARTAVTQGDANPMAQQQKILLYVMPLFLAVISFQFPLGILLYWVTTNAWQVVQQWIILREVTSEKAAGTLPDKPGGTAVDDAGSGDAPRRSPGASSGTKPVKKDPGGGETNKRSGLGDGSKDKKKAGSDRDGSGSTKSPTGKTPPKDGASSTGSSGGSSKDTPRPSKGTSSSSGNGGDGGSKDAPDKPGKGTTSANGSSSSGRGASSNGAREGGSGADEPRPGKRDHLPRRPRR